MKRLQWLFALVGIAGIVASLILPFSGGGMGASIGPDDPVRGKMYFLAGDVNVHIAVRQGGPISFYVFDWNDSMEMVRTNSLANVSPIWSRENITDYEGVIATPALGLYSFIVRSLTNESGSFHVDISRRLPQSHIFMPSVCVTAFGVVLGVLARVQTRRKPEP
jgi:hypothetical protein